MSRRRAQRQRQEQINILQAVTQSRNSRKEWTRALTWTAIAIVTAGTLIFAAQLLCSALLERTLYASPHYALEEIAIEPRDRFSAHLIRETAGLVVGQNLWTLDLSKIAHELETLPNVANARVERHFPNRLVIHLKERIPVVKIVALNTGEGTPETFYLDRDCIVLKPRASEPPQLLPEIVGLNNAELDPGRKLERPALVNALRLLSAVEASTLRNSIDIRTIDLSKPLFIRMVTTHDMAITFRLDYIDQQIDRLQQILTLADTQQRAIHTVDLSLDRNVPVCFYETRT